MKKVISLISLLFCALVYAQNSAIDNAQMSRDANEWPDAKKEIDKATLHEKTINQPKTWYYRGLIYSDIYASKDPAVKMLCDSANEVAINSYMKCVALENNPKGFYTKKMKTDLDNLWINSTNIGVEHFNAKNMLQAKKDFMVASKANPKDTVAPANILAACQHLKDTLCIIDSYQIMKDKGKDKPELYYWKYLYYQKKDTSIATKTLEDALSRFPNNESFNVIYIELLYGNRQYAKVKGKLLEYAKSHPKDKISRLRLAMIYEDANELDNATTQYQEVMALEPDNMIALYNLGVMKYKQSLKYLEEKDRVKPEERATKGKELDDKYKKTLYEASKHFEEYRKTRPDDDQAKNVLRDIYKRLKRDDLLQTVK